MSTSASRSVLPAAIAALVLVGGAHLLLTSRVPQPVVGLVVPEEEERAPAAADELAYIERVVLALSTWNKEQVKPLLAPQTLAGSNDDQLDTVLHTLGTRLGALQSIETPVLEAKAPLPGEPKNLVAYRALAHYDGGDADLGILLQRDAGVLHLYSFSAEATGQP